MNELPSFVRPMLARSSLPFDSEKYLFEIKWDGIRTLAFIESTGYRLISRHRGSLTAAFPELSFLGDLPAGTVLDGELVVFQQGRPRLSLVQGRKSLRSPHKIRVRSESTPATLIVFDQLYHQGQPLLDQPLWERRRIAAETVAARGNPRLLFSEGVPGTGEELYRQAMARELEGVMAKRVDSRYRPGQRLGAWLKIKPPRGSRRTVHQSTPVVKELR